MFSQIFIILLALPIISSILQKSNKFIVCNKCKHYIRPIYNEKYIIGNYLGKCSKFMEIDMENSELRYKYAVKARFYESNCGSKAKYYEECNKTNSDTTPNIPSL